MVTVLKELWYKILIEHVKICFFRERGAVFSLKSAVSLSVIENSTATSEC